MEIPLLDYHIHTVYSGHSSADMTVRNIIETAELRNLKSIVILEHAFYSLMGKVTLEQIKKEVQTLETKIKVLIGIEIDPDYKRKGHLVFEDFNRENIDVILVGTHTIPYIGKGWCESLSLTKKEKEIIYHKWFEITENVIENSPIDILAHPGRLISKNGIVEKFDNTVLKDFEYLFIKAKEKNIAFELNESMLKNFQDDKQKESYMDVIRLAISTGLKVSLGSDAHSLERIGERFYITRAVHECNISQKNLFIIKQESG